MEAHPNSNRKKKTHSVDNIILICDYYDSEKSGILEVAPSLGNRRIEFPIFVRNIELGPRGQVEAAWAPIKYRSTGALETLGNGMSEETE